MPDLKIDDATMTGIVTKALVDGMSTEAKAALIESAIKEHLLTKPKREGYYGGPEPLSPLQAAFNSAAVSVARTVCTEILTKDPGFQAKMRQLYLDACSRLFDKPERYEALVGKLSGAIDSALTKLAD